MLSLDALKQSVADMTAKVQAATTVEAGTAITVQTIVQQNKDLATQIAAMNPETITQADIDALSKQVSDQATIRRCVSERLRLAGRIGIALDPDLGPPAALASMAFCACELTIPGRH